MIPMMTPSRGTQCRTGRNNSARFNHLSGDWQKSGGGQLQSDISSESQARRQTKAAAAAGGLNWFSSGGQYRSVSLVGSSASSRLKRQSSRRANEQTNSHTDELGDSVIMSREITQACAPPPDKPSRVRIPRNTYTIDGFVYSS